MSITESASARRSLASSPSRDHAICRASSPRVKMPETVMPAPEAEILVRYEVEAVCD